MNAKEFIINHLNSFIEEFNNARVRYGYDALAQQHIIEVLPQCVFDSKEFLDWECDMYDKFVLEYPGEVIGFISEDALVGIDKVDFESEGNLYSAITTNPAMVFNTPVVNIEVSNSKRHEAFFSVSDLPVKENFEETFVSIDEYNYQLAA
jgi:hypothetical protein